MWRFHGNTEPDTGDAGKAINKYLDKKKGFQYNIVAVRKD